jgi:hypothetical protein
VLNADLPRRELHPKALGSEGEKQNFEFDVVNRKPRNGDSAQVHQLNR